MNNLEQLTANKEQCEHLIKLGIEQTAFLWWLELEDTTQEQRDKGTVNFEVCPVTSPFPGPYCVPAWTKAELDAMIGPEAGIKPDIFTREQLGNYKLAKPEYYPVFTIEKMQYFKNGADASAFALMYLIEKGKVTAKEANERYQKIFNPLK